MTNCLARVATSITLIEKVEARESQVIDVDYTVAEYSQSRSQCK